MCYDSPELFYSADRKARKTYKCCECSREIKPGDTYECDTGLWEGRWETYRTCSDCALLRSKFCSCWTYGDLARGIYECLGFDYRWDPSDPDCRFAPDEDTLLDWEEEEPAELSAAEKAKLLKGRSR
jgi:hypothetical protein